MKITYEEYDRIEEVCEKIKQINEETFPDEDKLFSGRYQYPTVAQLNSLNVEEHFEQFFLFLMYWYTQRFDDLFAGSPQEYKDYKTSMKYIKSVIERNLEFKDEEDEEEA